MEAQKVIDILKQAILLEKRGYSFYTTVAEQAKDPDIKNIFTIMAEEETTHVKFLSDQFASYEKNHKFLKVNLPDLANEKIATLVLQKKSKKRSQLQDLKLLQSPPPLTWKKEPLKSIPHRQKPQRMTMRSTCMPGFPNGKNPT